jgi:hypothetical protein
MSLGCGGAHARELQLTIDIDRWTTSKARQREQKPRCSRRCPGETPPVELPNVPSSQSA